MIPGLWGFGMTRFCNSCVGNDSVLYRLFIAMSYMLPTSSLLFISSCILLYKEVSTHHFLRILRFRLKGKVRVMKILL